MLFEMIIIIIVNSYYNNNNKQRIQRAGLHLIQLYLVGHRGGFGSGRNGPIACSILRYEGCIL